MNQILNDQIISRTWRAALDLQSPSALLAAKELTQDCPTLSDLASTLNNENGFSR